MNFYSLLVTVFTDEFIERYAKMVPR